MIRKVILTEGEEFKSGVPGVDRSVYLCPGALYLDRVSVPVYLEGSNEHIGSASSLKRDVDTGLVSLLFVLTIPTNVRIFDECRMYAEFDAKHGVFDDNGDHHVSVACITSVSVLPTNSFGA